MKLRRVTHLDDLDKIAEVAGQAFLEDPLFHFLNPGRHEHPSDWMDFWRFIIIRELLEPDVVAFVAELEQDDHTTKTTGFAIWKRFGHSEIAKSWKHDTLEKKIKLSSMYLKLVQKRVTGPKNQSISYEALGEIRKELARIQPNYPEEHWRLSYMGISPQHQRQGVGKMLIRWGLDRADEENVPATLEASNKGRGLYEQMGFVAKDWMSLDNGKIRQPVMIREVKR